MVEIQRCKVYSLILVVSFGLFAWHQVSKVNQLLRVLITMQIERSLLSRDGLHAGISGVTRAPVKIEINDWAFTVNNTYAVVFFGRRRQTEILLRYLEKSVKANGGVLDKIVFAVKTSKKEDLEYLDEIMVQKKPYIERIMFAATGHFREIYAGMNDNDLVFKIDDDVVFIANGTFEKMIQEYMSNQLLFLSANVVNHPLLSYVHARMSSDATLRGIAIHMEALCQQDRV
jgi:hypothetical protein